MDFIKSFFQIIVDAIKTAPTEVLIIATIIFAATIFIFRKKLRKIPLILFILLFAFLASHVPGFIVQYEQSFSGTLVGIEWSIEELNNQQIQEEIDNARQVDRLIVLYNKVKRDEQRFADASGIEKYIIFLTSFKKRVYNQTMKHYTSVIVLDSTGLIAILIGGLIGFLIWKIISWPFKALFNFKKERN